MTRRRAGEVCVSTDEAREVYEAQRDEICLLTLPPARELRDLHKELWIRSTFVVILVMLVWSRE